MKWTKRAFKILIAIRNLPGDLLACVRFHLDREIEVLLWKRMCLIKQFYDITFCVKSQHNQSEILAFVWTILTRPKQDRGVIFEARCYKGSSTAKFSLAAIFGGRGLIVFDSFQGIPDNAERLVHGARAVMRTPKNRSDRLSEWANRLKEGRGTNKAIVAVANKNARVIWAALHSGESYRQAA